MFASSAMIKRFVGAGVIAASAIVGTLAFGATPAQATGWNVDQGKTKPTSKRGWWALTYEANRGGMEYGLGACYGHFFDEYLGDAYYYCAGHDGTSHGYQQRVRNNAHSIISVSCYGATTWVYANAVGNFNWVHDYHYGTLNYALANNENSVGSGSLC